MNKVILFICVCVILGCSNRKEFAPSNDSITKEKAPTTISLENAYEILIEEKIQDHIDTQKLQLQYPNFKQFNDTTTSLKLNYQETIQDITLLDAIIFENENSTDIQTVITYDSNKQDTIIATIKRTKVLLDGEEITTSKIVLKEYKE